MATRTFTYKINMDLAGVKTGSKTMQVTLASMQGDAAKTDASMQKLADAIGKRYGVQTKIARDETRSFQNAIKQAARETNRAEKSYEQITREFKQLQSSIGMTTDELQVFNAQQRLGANATEQQKKQIANLVMGYQKMRNAANQTQGSMRGLRGQAQNVGWQLQDVAVQAQMGTNALIIIGQQGSQFASGFGSTGALIGAGIAVGTAAIGVLAPSLMKADKGLKELKESAKELEITLKKTAEGGYELTDSIKDLADKSIELAKVSLALGIQKDEKLIETASKGIKEAVEGIITSFDPFAVKAFDLRDFSKAVIETNKPLDDLAKTLDTELKFAGVERLVSALTKEFKISKREALDLGMALSDFDKNSNPVNVVRLQRVLEGLNTTYNSSNKDLLKLTGSLTPFFLAVSNGVDKINKGKSDLNDFNEALKGDADKSNLLSKLKEQLDLLSATELQQNLYSINRSKMSAADKKAARQVAINLAYQKDLIDTLEEGAKKDEKNATEKEKLAKANNDLVESMRQQADIAGYNATQNLNYQRGLKLAELASRNATIAQIELTNSYYDTLIAASELALQKAKDDKDAKASDTLLKSQVKSNRNIVESLRQQTDVIGYTATQNLNYQRGLKLLSLATQGATQDQIDATNAYYDKQAAALGLTESEKELTKTLNARAKRSDSGKLEQLKKQQADELKAVGDHEESIANINKYYAMERIKINGTVWEQMAVQSMEALKDTDEMMLQSMDRLVSGFGNAMTQVVMGSKKPGEALKDMFAGAIGSMVQFFAEWAAQKLILWALDKTLNAGTAASHATAMGANTGAKVAEAGLNAYAATAAIPIVGPALAPAAAGMAIAATSPMAATATTLASIGIGAFDRGGLIPAGGAGIVSEIGDELVGGTMVYNGSQNSLGVTGREDTARMRGGNGPVSITVNSSGNASPEAISRALVRALKRKSKGLDTGLYDAMNRGRTNRGKRFNA